MTSPIQWVRSSKNPLRCAGCARCTPHSSICENRPANGKFCNFGFDVILEDSRFTCSSVVVKWEKRCVVQPDEQCVSSAPAASRSHWSDSAHDSTRWPPFLTWYPSVKFCPNRSNFQHMCFFRGQLLVQLTALLSCDHCSLYLLYCHRPTWQINWLIDWLIDWLMYECENVFQDRREAYMCHSQVQRAWHCERDVNLLFHVKPCPHCRRKVRLSQKTARQRRQSHLSATVWTGFNT